MAPNSSKAPNGDGITASNEVQESKVAEKPSLEQGALGTLLEVYEDTSDEYNWISETFYRMSFSTDKDSFGTEEILVEQAQVQSKDHLSLYEGMIFSQKVLRDPYGNI